MQHGQARSLFSLALWDEQSAQLNSEGYRHNATRRMTCAAVRHGICYTLLSLVLAAYTACEAICDHRMEW